MRKTLRLMFRCRIRANFGRGDACIEDSGGLGGEREQCAYRLKKSLKRAEEIWEKE